VEEKNGPEDNPETIDKEDTDEKTDGLLLNKGIPDGD
jgi:hypothetical protein